MHTHTNSRKTGFSFGLFSLPLTSQKKRICNSTEIESLSPAFLYGVAVSLCINIYTHSVYLLHLHLGGEGEKHPPDDIRNMFIMEYVGFYLTIDEMK